MSEERWVRFEFTYATPMRHFFSCHVQLEVRWDDGYSVRCPICGSDWKTERDEAGKFVIRKGPQTVSEAEVMEWERQLRG